MDLSRFWRVHLEAAALDYPGGDSNGSVQTRLEQVFTFSKNFEARLTLKRQGPYKEAVVTSNLYFGSSAESVGERARER